MKRFFSFVFPILTLLSLLYIFSNSLASEPEAMKKKSAVVKEVEKIIEVITKEEVELDAKKLPVVSKIAHVIEFSAFSFFFTASVIHFGASPKKQYYQILFTGCMVALADEQLQLLSNGRNSRVSDVVIDLAGVWIGYFLATLLAHFLHRRKQNAKCSSDT